MNHLEAEFNNEDYKSISKIDIDYLKKKADSSVRGRYRLCLHDSISHLTQEMMICLKKYSYFQPHKHPINYSESYHLIEGEIDVYLMDNNGIIFDEIKLSEKNSKYPNNFYYRLSSPIYHLVVPRSEWVIYHEVSTGPFIKKNNVIYAGFAPEESSSKDKIIIYMNDLLQSKSPYI
jgi:cupin fold WbuC family metalloprotein